MLLKLHWAGSSLGSDWSLVYHFGGLRVLRGLLFTYQV